MSRYQALHEHLAKTENDIWQASFPEIERIIGGSLPKSAWRHQAWWANQSDSSARPQAASWLAAGWRTVDLDLVRERVTFVKATHGITPSDNLKPKNKLCWPDVIVEDCSYERLELNVSFSWARLSKVRLDHRKRLTFPPTPLSPAVYRFNILAALDESIYIGEAEEISRRFQHYRTPSPTQQTNKRLNEVMVACIEGEGTVSIDVILEARLKRGSVQTELDLMNKNQRRMLEYAALVEAQLSGVSTLNR